MPRKGRSVRDQVGQAWVFVPITLVILLVYFAYGQDLESRTYLSARRGVRNPTPRTQTPAILRRGSSGSGHGGGADTEEDAHVCEGTLPARGRTLIAQTIVGDVVTLHKSD